MLSNIELEKKLNQNKSTIRYHIGAKLEAQYVPQIRFEFDKRYAKSARIEDLLNKTGLLPFKDRYPAQLSGGQQLGSRRAGRRDGGDGHAGGRQLGAEHHDRRRRRGPGRAVRRRHPRAQRAQRRRRASSTQRSLALNGAVVFLSRPRYGDEAAPAPRGRRRGAPPPRHDLPGTRRLAPSPPIPF